jgi:ferritin-like metal-binding protein YciE
MKLKDFQSLFVHELKDLYSAEKQVLKALPKMIKAISNEGLRNTLQEHREQTQQQIERIEQLCRQMGISMRGAKCPGMEGLVEEGRTLLEEEASPEILDAAILGAAQRIEHYEIAACGCLRTYAQQLGLDNAARMLQDTLNEESEANERLTRIAMSRVNPEAMASAGAGSHNGHESS